jgi:hypothetical protein
MKNLILQTFCGFILWIIGCLPLFSYCSKMDSEGYVVTYDKPVKMSIAHRSDHPEMASWQQWDMSGKPAGGFRSNDNLNKGENILYFGAHLNNVDDATGMYYWGKRLNDSSLADKARRIINLALSAPQNKGLFPNGYDVNNYSWIKRDYHTEAASATACFLEKTGGVYINFEKELAVGIDGISVEKYELNGQKINITLKSLLAELTVPYSEPFIVDMKIEGLPGEEYELVVNNGSGYKIVTKELASIPLFIDQKGKIRLNKEKIEK